MNFWFVSKINNHSPFGNKPNKKARIDLTMVVGLVLMTKPIDRQTKQALWLASYDQTGSDEKCNDSTYYPSNTEHMDANLPL